MDFHQIMLLGASRVLLGTCHFILMLRRILGISRVKVLLSKLIVKTHTVDDQLVFILTQRVAM